MRADKYERPQKRKWVKRVWIAVLTLFVIAGGYAFYLYKQLENTVETMHGDLDREKSDKRTDNPNLRNNQPFSVLLMGVDEREGDKGRSDTLIAITVNPDEPSVKMVSIPRDTRTLIVGKGIEDKINHSYAYGGTSMTVRTVEHFLDIPIDYYIKINMEGFKDIVDAVGGIDVDSPLAFTEDGISFQKGKNHLNGRQALAYVRMRKQDPRGDTGRQLRQRQVIQGVINRGANPIILTKMDHVLGAIGSNAQTDLSFDEMKIIQQNYHEARHNIQQLQIEGTGTRMNGIYYLIVPPEKRNAISAELKQHLDL